MISISEYRGVDFCKAHSILRLHYDLGRKLTSEEIKSEIDNLIRKAKKQSLDDQSEYLYIRIFGVAP